MVRLLVLLIPLLAPGDNDPAGSIVIDRDPEARQPQIAVDGQQRIFVAYGAGPEIRCARSTDGGQTFEPPVVVARVPRMALGMRRGPRIAASDNAVVITAVVHAENEKEQAQAKGLKPYESATGDLVAWRSTDAGQTWTQIPNPLNQQAGSAREGLHDLAGRPDGHFYCVWLDLTSGVMTLHGSSSADGGASWQPDREVHHSPEKAICTCCHPSIEFAPNGSLALMWRDDVKGARDMYLRRSSDAGATFGPPEKLGLKTWIYAQCPMDGGAVANDARGDTVTAWMRAGEVYVAGSGGRERSLGPGFQPWIAGSAAGPITVWLSRRPGPLVAEIPGRSEAQTLANLANDPVVASAPDQRGPVVAAWEAVGENARGIAFQVLLQRP